MRKAQWHAKSKNNMRNDWRHRCVIQTRLMFLGNLPVLICLFDSRGDSYEGNLVFIDQIYWLIMLFALEPEWHGAVSRPCMGRLLTRKWEETRLHSGKVITDDLFWSWTWGEVWGVVRDTTLCGLSSHHEMWMGSFKCVSRSIITSTWWKMRAVNAFLAGWRDREEERERWLSWRVENWKYPDGLDETWILKSDNPKSDELFYL